jgi:hypothetical protein
MHRIDTQAFILRRQGTMPLETEFEERSMLEEGEKGYELPRDRVGGRALDLESQQNECC